MVRVRRGCNCVCSLMRRRNLAVFLLTLVGVLGQTSQFSLLNVAQQLTTINLTSHISTLSLGSHFSLRTLLNLFNLFILLNLLSVINRIATSQREGEIKSRHYKLEQHFQKYGNLLLTDGSVQGGESKKGSCTTLICPSDE
ncbi:hypothetical protein PCYB_053670, partial [Plasmodium cynomolgi strain B]